MNENKDATYQNLWDEAEPVSRGKSVSAYIKKERGTWVAQSVGRPTSAQVMISWSMGLSPASGSVLTAQSLETALDSVSPSLSVPTLLMLSLSLSKVNKH